MAEMIEATAYICFEGQSDELRNLRGSRFESMCLALQLHLSSEVSAASVGLVSSPPERPCENTVDRDAPLSELDSDATDFLDRPADQERCLVRRRRVFLSAGSALAR